MGSKTLSSTITNCCLLPQMTHQRLSMQCPPHLLAALGRTLDGEEIRKALRDTTLEKSPGLDGVLAEFYVKFGDLI